MDKIVERITRMKDLKRMRGRESTMKKVLTVFSVVLMILGVSTSAYAFQYAYGAAAMDLSSFDYSYSYVDQSNDNGKSGVGYRQVGVYSAGFAYAFDEYSQDADAFHSYVLDGWAAAYTDGSFAATGVGGGFTGSYAEAVAGDGYGEESGAVAGSFVAAYGFYAKADIDLTIQMDYYLEGEVGGDGFGYSEAGSGAILGIYADGIGIDGDWQDVNSDDDTDYYWEDNTLFASLRLKAGDYLTFFAGTAAYAYATEEAMPVPEPASMFLLGAGFLIMAGLGRKRLIKG